MKQYKSLSGDHNPNSSSSSSSSQESKVTPRVRDWNHGLPKPVAILVMSLMNIAVLVFIFHQLKEPQLSDCSSAAAKPPPKVSDDEGLRRDEVPKLDKLLGGLLVSGFDEGSCLSRYESVEYLKELKRHPSSSLISKLRSYEDLHRRCGPYTDSFNKSVEIIKSGRNKLLADADCKYLVWAPLFGVGNRLISLVSSFLYAILTNRVLLVSSLDHTAELFCEPFLGTSWNLPADFPITDSQFFKLDQNSSFSYGYMVKNNLVDNFNASSDELPPFIHINLAVGINYYDELFFEDEDQKFLQKMTWLTLRSDEYFAPSLFLIPSFKKDLENMFPDKDSVFHLLGRYLIHPTNPVWELITRYHESYLAGADEIIGIQVRVFDENPGPFQHVLDQIMACSMKENILPPPIKPENPRLAAIAKNRTDKKRKKTKAVLVTSLSSWYADRIRDMYLQHPTATGDVIQVHQPSHEEEQKWQEKMHYSKAFTEMYLLGMSDRLVTSGESTFGYVAQGLGGLQSWVLYKPENLTAPDPPCQRVVSMDPCFHLPPPLDDSTAALVPYLRRCEDRIRGLKLYPDN